MSNIKTLITDIYRIASTGVPVAVQGPETDKIVVEYATRSGEFFGKKIYPEDRVAKPRSERTIRMSELGTPCLRQLILKWYTPEYGAPPYTYEPDPTLGVKFGYGSLIEEFVLSLAEVAGHKVEGKQRQVEISLADKSWTAKGSIDAVVDGVLVDVKSASKFAFDKYRKEGFTDTNDTFGYSFQLNGYKYALQQELGAPIEANFLFVEKETGRIQIVPPMGMLKSDVETRMKLVGSAAEAYLKTGRLPGVLPTSTHKYGRVLGVACSYCQFKHACFPDLVTYVERGRPINLTQLSAEGERFVKIQAKDIWKRPAKKVPTTT